MKKILFIIAFICAACFAFTKVNAQVSVGISVGFAPPALPVYVQPACPVDGYLWIPGYWAYDNVDGYYWVPGYWSAPPRFGLLWTPAYWGYSGGYYGFHTGYWGAHVGFYGGINYGYGYGGSGFVGGGWYGNRFRYNTAVVNVNTTVVRNTYVDRTVINNVTVNNHTSFNGPGGVAAQPKPEEMAAMREQHVQPTSQQQFHQQHASQDKTQFAKYNGGHPTATAMDKVGGKPINEHGEVAANSKLGNPNGNRKMNYPNAGGTGKPNGQNPQMKQEQRLHQQPQRQLQPQQRQPQRQPQQPQRQPQRQPQHPNKPQKID